MNTMNTTKTKGLKRCPFCRKWDTLTLLPIRAKQGNICGYKVLCDFAKDGCGASGGMRKTAEKAVNTWNTRFSLDHIKREAMMRTKNNPQLNIVEINELIDIEQDTYQEIEV